MSITALHFAQNAIKKFIGKRFKVEDKNNAFVLYASYAEILQDLEMEDLGNIFKAILNYKARGEIIKLPTHLTIIFKFIKNQLDIDAEKYTKKVEKLKSNGSKGGRPKKPNGFFEEHEKPNGFFENHNDNVNVNDNVNAEKKQKQKTDPFINSIKTFFENEYQKIFYNKPRLSLKDCNRLLELTSENADIKELIPIALIRLKNIDFSEINFTPTANWLLKENNFERVINGEFEPKKSPAELYRERRQLCENC